MEADWGCWYVDVAWHFNTQLYLLYTETNQIEVSQNAADKNSELSCDPECPQV